MKNLCAGKVCLVLVVFAVATAWSADSFAATTIHLKATGDAQGVIPGESTITSLGRTDTIVILEWHHLIRNEGGKKQHEPIVFLKPISKATPPFYNALNTGENFTLQFMFFRPAPGGSGAEQWFQTIHLSQARIMAIEPITRNVLEPEGANLPHMERIRVTYGQITISDEVNGTEAVLTNTAPQ
ncbi:MAG: type VI secretion system tube protein TssD [Acidobacteriota bacterium]